MNIQKDLSIIIVSYNTEKLLINCLNSIVANTTGVDYEIIVIDNNSKDCTVKMLKLKFPECRLIINNDNIGFARANNQGVRVAKGRNILFLNPDTLLFNNAIPKMLDFITKHKDIGIVGPMLYKNEKKEYHPSIRIFSKPVYTFLSFLPLSGLLVSIYNRYLVNKNKIRRVDWLWGAALLVKKEMLDKIGLFDEHFFLYSEEEDLCLRAYKNGYKVYYFPAAEIIHFKGKSAETSNIEPTEHFWRSKLYFFRKYCSPWNIRLFKIYFGWLLKLKMFLKIIPSPDYDYYRVILETIKNDRRKGDL